MSSRMIRCEGSTLPVDGIRTAMTQLLPCGQAVCPVCWQTVVVTREVATLRFVEHSRELPVNPMEDRMYRREEAAA